MMFALCPLSVYSCPFYGVTPTSPLGVATGLAREKWRAIRPRYEAASNVQGL